MVQQKVSRIFTRHSRLQMQRLKQWDAHTDSVWLKFMTVRVIVLANMERTIAGIDFGDSVDFIDSLEELLPNRNKEARAFSLEQERVIRETMKVCENAGCEGPDHKEHD